METHQTQEWKRLRAWELKELGWTQKAIAEAMGVTAGAVSQWMKRGREGGVDALKAKPSTGPHRKLSPDQRSQLLSALVCGAEAWGYAGNVWTTARISDLLKNQLGIDYHPHSVTRLMRELGWSWQKPKQRATQRDEEAIVAWQAEQWPAIKKKRMMREPPSFG